MKKNNAQIIEERRLEAIRIAANAFTEPLIGVDETMCRAIHLMGIVMDNNTNPELLKRVSQKLDEIGAMIPPVRRQAYKRFNAERKKSWPNLKPVPFVQFVGSTLSDWALKAGKKGGKQ